MNFEKIYNYAIDNGCKAEYDVPMSSYTTFRIGGNARLMVTPESDEALADIIKLCKAEGAEPFILGNGSNMLISDNGLDRVVINMCRQSAGVRLVDEETIECDAGINLVKVCRFALENNLTGLEFAYGIPGSAGGAAYMNAGAYGGEMIDVLASCRHIDKDGNFGSFAGKELGLGYRTSAYEKNGYIITTLTFKLKKGNHDEIKAKMDELLGRRKDKQPLEYPSAGSTFKRPEKEGFYASRMIDECGLKGLSVGGAQVSEKHAGFVINKGGASSTDVMNLIEKVQQTVFEKTGIMLEPEVRLIEK